MKLFHKFLIALLVISIVPLAVYSFITLNSTGETLKKIINENNINLSINIVREVNEFFSIIKSKTYFAKEIERNKSMADHIIFKEINEGEIVSGVLLLDSKLNTVTGWGLNRENLNEEIINRTLSTGKCEVTPILRTESEDMFIDAAYNVSKKSKETLYIRYNPGYLIKKVKPYLKGTGKPLGRKNVFIIDPSSGTISVYTKTFLRIPADKLNRYAKLNQNEVFIEEGNLNIVQKISEPGWMTLFQEPVSSAYFPVKQLWIISAILILATSGFALLVAFLLANNLYKPLKILVEGMEKVSEGNLDYQLKILSNDELSKSVSIFNSMTAKLKKLQNDMRAKERLSAMGQMANVLGHEIRNLLGAIVNALYIIKHYSSKETQQSEIIKYVEIIEKEIKSMEKIINNMLDFSRTRSPILEKINIAEFLDDILKNFNMPENITLDFEKKQFPEITLDLDIEEIKQVIRNILNNSIESMEAKEKGVLKIRLLRTVLEKYGESVPAIRLEITDTGNGVPPENISKIFEPFFSTKSKGTGLGLSVVKKIIEERHGGKVEVKSGINEGTTFIIILPINSDKNE
ncbi:MAG: ATP-binding protein [Elusimicrobia bacterium]|nr:ATP-binding protein [Elusimicrobiota bacterium]